MTAALTLDPATARGALSAVQDALALLAPALEDGGDFPPDQARRTAADLHRAAAGMTALAEQAEEALRLPDNVIDFAAAHRARRDRLRSGGAP